MLLEKSVHIKSNLILRCKTRVGNNCTTNKATKTHMPVVGIISSMSRNKILLMLGFYYFLSKQGCARFQPMNKNAKILFCLCWKYNFMRQEFEKILGEELRYLAIETRERLGLTQKEMGEELQMGEGSYSDLERGETGCASALTETLLLNMQEYPRVFLNRLAERYAQSLQLV